MSVHVGKGRTEMVYFKKSKTKLIYLSKRVHSPALKASKPFKKLFLKLYTVACNVSVILQSVKDV